MVGLVLGDSARSLPRDPRPVYATPKRVSVGTALGQLACYTVEGMIRGLIRGEERGIGNQPAIVSLAYCRWARRQGLSVGQELSEWEGAGWLADVAPLGEIRGRAPATATAVERGFGSRDVRGGSSGHHALTRTAPLALFTWPVAGDSVDPAESADADEFRYPLQTILEWAADLAALTHGDPAAWDAAVAGVLLLACCLGSDSVADARSLAQALGGRCSEGVADLLAGRGSPPPNTASAAFLAGTAAAECSNDAGEAIAHGLEHGAGSATFAGAIVGAVGGLTSLPVAQVTRLELGWVADRLAQDAVRQCRQHPGLWGYYGDPPLDPMWPTLYPPN